MINKFSALSLLALPIMPSAAANVANKPNIVFIYLDDLGYGDLSCYSTYSSSSLCRKIGHGTTWRCNNGPLRGGKYSLYEAGCRVPLFTYWKGKIKPQVSDALICQIDLLESLAALVGTAVKPTDSQNLLKVLLGKSKIGRESLVLEANTKTAFRQGDWLLIPPYPGDAVLEEVNIEIGCSPEYQLYNLKDDIAQKNNLAKSKPQLLAKLKSEFENIRGNFNTIEAIELK